MSEENVENVRRANDAFNRRDFDGFTALADPDIEVYSLIVASLEGGEPYHGYDGIQRWWETALGLAPDMDTEIDEVRAIGGFTVSRIHIRGHGIDSDAPIDQVTWQVAEWRDGKCLRLRFGLTEAEALAAAGLSE